MKDIKTLVNLITRRGEKNIPLLYFNKDAESTSKELELYFKTRSGEFHTEMEASQGIYGTEVPDHRFKMLKSRVKQKLLNHLFFLNYEDERIGISARYEEECLRFLHFSRLLINEGELRIAEKLLNKCLYLSQEGEFTYIIISCLELLKDIHTERLRPIHYKNTKEEADHYRELSKMEQEVKDLYSYYTILLSKSSHSRKKSLQKAESVICKLKELYEKDGSYEIFEKYYKLKLLFLQLTGRFDEMIALTKAVDADYEASKINLKRFDINFNKLMKLYAHLQGKDYSNGIRYAKKIVIDFPRSSESWFSFMEYYFLLTMHIKSYDAASGVINKALINFYFDKIPEDSKLRWNLYRGYLYLVHEDESLLRNYDYNVYFEEIPEFNRQRAGLNAAILILQFLDRLKENRSRNIRYIMDELGKYINSCPDSFSKRTKVFYKLLVIAVKCSLDLRTIKAKTKYLSSKLKEIDTTGGVYDEIEILPYEQLWDTAFKYLKINQVKAEM